MAVCLVLDTASAAERYRVLSPSADTRRAAVLLVPGCSGFVARNGYNLYEDRAGELQTLGYLVVFIDYLAWRNLADCAGGRDVSHSDVGSDILKAAAWIKEQPDAAAQKIFAIGWSYGGGGLLAALRAMPGAPARPLIVKAVL